MGRQDGLKGNDGLHLNKCSSLVPEGAGLNLTRIKFRDNLKLGAFDPASGNALSYSVPGSSANEAYSDYFLWLEECKDLDINGNNQHFKVGGGVGDTGYQVNKDGIMLMDCNAVTLTQLKTTYFGCDGLDIKHCRPKTLS